MNSLSVIESTNDLIKQEEYLNRKLNDLKSIRYHLERNCEHEIAVKYTDGLPRLQLVQYCYCPACRKKVRILNGNLGEFVYSSMIDLTMIDLLDDDELLDHIRNEVVDNYDFYYDKDISLQEKKSKMLETMQKYNDSLRFTLRR